MLMFLTGIGSHAMAQVTVTGKVEDSKQEPLIGATVLEKGTSNGTVTDALGNYTIAVRDGAAVLQVSYIGYSAQEVAIEGRSTIDVTLQENSQQLSEVVVTALGFEESKDELGYASSTVTNKQLSGSGESTMLNSMSGKASGIRISRNSGDPGAGAYIQIRGLSTITRDAQPLIVVDGVPISNDTRDASGGSQGRIAQQSRLNDLNPNDIESVSVLKGASAAALWGTKALGGVIYITTKKGKGNKGLSVNYKTTYSIDQINRRYPMQSAFGQGDNGVYNPRARDSWGDKIANRSGAADDVDTNGEYYVDQDGNVYYSIINKNSQETFNDKNFDQVFQNGHFWENNVSVSGGNENSTLFMSISDLNQQGIIRNNSDYRRTSARVNVTHKFTDKIKLTATSTYSKSISNRIRRGASSSGLYLGLVRTPPDFDNTGYRGDYFANSTAAPVSNRHRSYREPLGADGTATYNNPLWTINEQENLAQVDRFITSFELNANPVKWLELIGRVGVDQYSEQRQEFITPGSASGEYLTGFFDTELAHNSIFNMDWIAKASKAFNENFDASILVGFNFNHKKLKVDGSNISSFIQFTDVASGLRDIDNALPENRIVNSTFGQERTVGAYTSATVSAYNMFFLNATLRNEAASAFGDGKNTFLFPSASLAWHFTKVTSLKPAFLSFGKLRVSYGEVGVQPERYNTSNVYVAPTYSDLYGGNLGLPLYGSGGFVASVNRGGENLKPERKKETEYGIDLRFLQDRLSFSGTIYSNKTEDVLLNLPIANSRGYSLIYGNAGTIENKGMEIDLGYNVLNTRDWNINVNVVYSKVRNKVIDLVGIDRIDLGGLAAVSSNAIEGHAIGTLWGSRILRDEKGDIVFDANGFPEQDQNEGIIGDPNPDWQGSISTSISYKRFSLNALFETFQGADIYAGTKAVMYDLGTWDASAHEATANQNLLDFSGNVIPQGTSFRGKVYNFGAGPVALTEAWYNLDGGFFGGGNDELYIEDGSWTRLRELSLSYSANPTWLKSKLGLKGAELTVTGRNLFLWTPFEGNDPDTNLSGVSISRGIDYFNNPGTKSYIFSLSLTF